jgi:hypothetical protein
MQRVEVDVTTEDWRLRIREIISPLGTDTVGGDKDFGIPRRFVIVFPVCVGTCGCVISGAVMTSCQESISYLILKLVVKAGSTIWTLNQDDRVWNGISLHLQVRRRPEPCPQPKKLERSVF